MAPPKPRMTPCEKLADQIQRVTDLIIVCEDARAYQRLSNQLDKLIEKIWEVIPD